MSSLNNSLLKSSENLLKKPIGNSLSYKSPLDKKRNSSIIILEKIYLPSKSSKEKQKFSSGKKKTFRKQNPQENFSKDLEEKTSFLRSETHEFKYFFDIKKERLPALEKPDISMEKRFRRKNKHPTILSLQPIKQHNILEEFSEQKNIDTPEIRAIFSRIKQINKEEFQKISSPISSLSPLSKTNPDLLETPKNDMECLQILREEDYEWSRLRKRYQNRYEIMYAMTEYRDRAIKRILHTVDRQLREESQSGKPLVVFEAHGNKDPLSDLDITIVATTTKRYYEAEALSLAHKIFKQNGWPKSLSSVFDAQLYISYFPIPPGKATYLDTLEEEKLSPSKIDIEKLRFWTKKRNAFYTENGKRNFHILQFRGAFIQFINLAPNLWKPFKLEILKKTKNKRLNLHINILKQAEDLISQTKKEREWHIAQTYQRDNEIYQKMIKDSRRSFKVDLHPNPLLYFPSQKKISLDFQKTEKEEKVKKIISIYPDYQFEAQDQLYDKKTLLNQLSIEHFDLVKKYKKISSVSQETKNTLKILSTIAFPMFQKKNIENLKVLIDKKHLDLIEKNINAHIHATEGYLLEGSIKHVVYELQSQNPDIPPLNAMDYLESFLEQSIFFLYKSDKEDVGGDDIILISKYAFRALDAIQKAIFLIEKLNLKTNSIRRVLSCKDVILSFFAMRNSQTTELVEKALVSLDFPHPKYKSLDGKRRSMIVKTIFSQSPIKNLENLKNLFFHSLVDVSAWYFCHMNQLLSPSQNK